MERKKPYRNEVERYVGKTRMPQGKGRNRGGGITAIRGVKGVKLQGKDPFLE